MLRYTTAHAVALTMVLSWPLDTAGQAPTAGMKCDAGPVSKTLGKRQWLVYSCADGRSIVFFSAPETAAKPFFFMLAYQDGQYRFVSESSHSEQAAAAVEDLKKMSSLEIAALLEQTQAMRGKKQKK